MLQEQKNDDKDLEQTVQVQKVETQIVQAPPEKPPGPRTIKDLEKTSVKYRSYKVLYILSMFVVELVILLLVFFTYPRPATFFDETVETVTLTPIYDLTWLNILILGNIIAFIFFYIIRRTYYYIVLGKKFWEKLK